MRALAPSRIAPLGARAFDVICAGDAAIDVATQAFESITAGGSIRAALALARRDLRVGLATVLVDDSAGRRVQDRVAAAGVDVGGLQLSRPSSALFFVRGGARQIVREESEDAPATIPEGWSSAVLLLSGLSPIVSHAAAACKAARAARRDGTLVVVDLQTSSDAWRGRDWRSLRMILHEADVVYSCGEAIFGLPLDAAKTRSAMRPEAVLAMHRLGRATANGPFGEVAHPTRLGPPQDDIELLAAICAELKHAGKTAQHDAKVWQRAFTRFGAS